MSYSAAAALQNALYTWLSQAPSLAQTPVYDATPTSPEAQFILIGPEQVRDVSDQTGKACEHRIEISVISDAPGFAQAKAIAGHICTLFEGAPPTLSQGTIRWMTFERGQANRLAAGKRRRIDLTFRLRIEL